MKTRRCLLALALLLVAESWADAQLIRRPRVGFDERWEAERFRPWWRRRYYPYLVPYPVPYPVPYASDTTNNYYAPLPAKEQSANQGVVAIYLPTTAAVVWIDGRKMESGLSDTRVYNTPELEPGHTYQYTVKAQWVRRGDNVSAERVVTVSAGQTSVVDFTKE